MCAQISFDGFCINFAPAAKARFPRFNKKEKIQAYEKQGEIELSHFPGTRLIGIYSRKDQSRYGEAYIGAKLHLCRLGLDEISGFSVPKDF